MTKIAAGRGHVAVQWGSIAVISVYLPPSLREFCRRLKVVGRLLRRLCPGPVIIAGDFNAKAAVWGSPRTDGKGVEVLEWAAEHDLIITNSGTQHTCVRRKGGWWI